MLNEGMDGMSRDLIVKDFGGCLVKSFLLKLRKVELIFLILSLLPTMAASVALSMKRLSVWHLLTKAFA